MWRADRGRDIAAIAHTSRQVVLADTVFTAPAVIAQPLTGIAMTLLAGIPLHTPWVAASLVLFVLIGCCWLPVVWLQWRVARNAAALHAAGSPPDARHDLYMRIWYALGWPAFLGIIAIFYLMVMKPPLW